MRNYNSNQSPYHSPDYVHGGGENADQLVGEPVNNNNSRNNDTVMPVDNMAILANLQAQHQKPHGEIHSMNRFAYQYKDLNEHQATQQSSEIDENHLMPGGEEMDIHRFVYCLLLSFVIIDFLFFKSIHKVEYNVRTKRQRGCQVAENV